LPRLHSTGDRLEQIPGQPPSLLRPPPGCAFHPRCAYAFDRCRAEVPPLVQFGGDQHLHRCLLGDDMRARTWAEKKAAMKAAEAA